MRLRDQFTQKGYSDLENSQKGYNYRLYKSDFKTENYFNACKADHLKILFCTFRTCTHKLAVELGRYQYLLREDRHCTICNEFKLGDEYNFVIECPTLNDIRSKHVPNYYMKHPSAIKFGELLSTNNKHILLKLLEYKETQ